MQVKNKWFIPYEGFGFHEIAENIALAGKITSMQNFSPGRREYIERTLMPFYNKDGLRISFYIPFLGERPGKDESGREIYYPIRPPEPKEIILEKRGHMTGGFETPSEIRKIYGFGDTVCLCSISEEDVVVAYGKEMYPYTMFLRGPAGAYYSIGIVDRDTQFSGPANAMYWLWKPVGAATDRKAGKGYVPVDLPSLKLIRLKLTKTDISKVYEELPAFES